MGINLFLRAQARTLMLTITPFFRPPLDPSFIPAALWNRAYRAIVAADPEARTLTLTLERPDAGVSRHQSRVLAANHADAPLSLRYAERLLKFLLWQKGGCTVKVAGAPEIAEHLAAVYSAAGARSFDHAFMGERVYRKTFSIEFVDIEALPKERVIRVSLGPPPRGMPDRIRHRRQRPEGRRGR